MSFNEVLLVSPLIILFLGCILVLLSEAFIKDFNFSEELTIGILFAAIATIWWISGNFEASKTIFHGSMYADPFAAFMTVLILGGSLLVVLLGIRQLRLEGVRARGEYYSLLLMSSAGAIVFVSAAELITLFLGLEIMSMALYCLCGSALDLRRSTESGMKYFLLGSFSSGFLLYGMALVYGITGSTRMQDLAGSLALANETNVALALGLMLVGLIFKIGAVPFHFWAPDVYEGAPTPVTAYMACVIKVAAVGAAMRVLWIVFEPYIQFWSGFIWVAAVLTMLFGNIVALRQRSLKRMLAYSSIAHAGYILVAFLAPGEAFGGGAAILYYLIAYTVMTIGAFGVVLAVSSPHAAEADGDDIVRFNGLANAKPMLAAVMALFMLSLAGIPPGMAGLLGKFYIFNAAVKSGYIGIAIIGVLASAVSCYYYLRVIVAMYFVENLENAQDSGNLAVVGAPLGGTLGLCALAVILMGVYPSLLHNVAQIVMSSF